MAPRLLTTLLLAAAVAAVSAGPRRADAQQPAVSAAVPTGGARPSAAPGTPALRQEVFDGNVQIDSLAVNGSGVQSARATILVNAPPEAVMRAITDYAHYAEFMPSFEASRVLSRRGNNAIVYIQAKAVRNTTTIWAQLRIYQRRSRGTTQIVEGRMMQGNVNRLDALWEITPVDGGTRSMLVFQILIDPDLPFPDSMVSDENRRVSRRGVLAVRQRVMAAQARLARRGN